jgi:ABC-2 type transport system ATP-binding protein
VRAADYAGFTKVIAGTARRHGIRLFETVPADESLESVFSYLVRR